MRFTASLPLLALPLLVVGCRPKPAAPKVAAPLPPGMPLKGKVIERIDAAPYSYLRLDTGAGEAWAAVPQTSAGKDAEVTVVGAMAMQNFDSKSLNRRFALVYFGTLQDPVGSSTPTIQHALAAQGPSDVQVPHTAKAPGAEGRTVEELFAQRDSLKDKPVAVQGQVVKVNLGIMGKNWLHLRDGSGQGPTADLTVTTAAKAEVGDVVIARGVLRLDRDFGAGYKYNVVLEDAKLTPGKR